MDPATLALIALAVQVLETHGPQLVAALKDETISPEEQAKVREQFDRLRGVAAFTGPEWVPSTLKPTTPPPNQDGPEPPKPPGREIPSTETQAPG